MITVEEKYLGRQLSRSAQSSGEVVYIVQGTEDDTEAVNAVIDATPVFHSGLPRVDVSATQIAAMIWEVVCKYGFVQNDRQQGESSFSFETSGGTQHITQSITTRNRYAPSGKVAPNYNGAIAVDHGGVQGCDITVPIYTWTDTYIFADAFITPNYKATLYDLTGRVNASQWRNYPAGEVLFMGASGSKRGNYGDWELSFKFAASPNVTGMEVGDITGIAKNGWDYLWIRYDDDSDPDAKVLIKKPTAVYVEQVYKTANFAGLGV